MNITVIYANKRKENSCTYGIAQELTGQLLDGGRLHEFYLPWDMPHVCTGCYACINGHPERCGGYPHLKPILDAFADSELLVFCSPVYAFHTPGQMKTLLDHLAYRWLLHQWDGGMMRKQAVIICTAGGGGLKSAAKDIRDSMEFWGVAAPGRSPPASGATTGPSFRRTSGSGLTGRLPGRSNGCAPTGRT